VAQPPQAGFRLLIIEILDHTKLDTHKHGRSPLNEWWALHRAIWIQNTWQTTKTNIHAISGFGTRDPSNGAASELLLGSYGHRERQHKCLAILKVCVCVCVCENDNQGTVRVKEMLLFVTTHMSYACRG